MHWMRSSSRALMRHGAGKRNRAMSRSIYERRQLRPYAVRWTVRAD